MTNIGTAFLLAGVLFFAERNFVELVTKRAGEAASRTATAATAELRQSQDDLRTRLDDLQGRVREAVEQTRSRDAETISRLDEDVSFETLTRALEKAHDTNAFADNQVTVTADGKLRGLRVSVSWLQYSEHVPWREEWAGQKVLAFEVEQRSPAGRTPTRCTSRWEPSQSAAEFGEAMIAQMVRSGLGAEAKGFNLTDLMRSVQRAIGLAVASRLHEDEGWLTAPLAELLGPWAITEAGLEHEDHGVALMSGEFPERLIGPASRRKQGGPEPGVPSWCDPAEWAYIYGLGKRHHPPGPVAVRAAVQGHAWPVRP